MNMFGVLKYTINTRLAHSLYSIHPSFLATMRWWFHFFLLFYLSAAGLAISRTWSLISFNLRHRCIRLGQTGHPYVLLKSQKTRKASPWGTGGM
jgi:hypothetical protein